MEVIVKRKNKSQGGGGTKNHLKLEKKTKIFKDFYHLSAWRPCDPDAAM